MAEVTLLIHDLAAAVTPEGTGPLRGRKFGALRIHSPASIAVAGDRISAVGPPAEILRELPSGTHFESVDGRGKVALPGLVDCHTHPTFLGAHTIPPEFDSAVEYVEFVIYEVLPEAASLAGFADVFLERGSFEVPGARRYLEACQEYGLALRFHADQFSERGAIPLALELGARSVDHLETTQHEAAILLAKSDVAAVLLPACGLFLDLPLPPARLLADEGAILALATDFNPGSSFCESLPLVM